MTSRCSLCPGTRNCVPGNGPVGALVMCIGEAPGADEDKHGICFTGRAGREYNENYLTLAGLQRSLVYTTNTMKCRPDQNRKPNYKEIWSCAPHFLPGELESIQPTVVILMGATACSLVPNIDLEAQHGIPFYGEMFGWSGWIVPMYHPALGLHKGETMGPMMDDWSALKWWLRDGEWVWPERDERPRDYRLARSVNEVDRYFLKYGGRMVAFKNGGDERPWLGVDTESHGGKRFSIQVSCKVDTGLMILMDDARLQHALAYWIEPYEWAMHNAEADLWIREPDALDLPDHPYRDTMQEVYQLGYYRQALKTMAFRILGRLRPSWEEVVTPPSKAKLAEWMQSAMVYTEDNWRITTQRTHKTTGKPLKPDVKRSEAEKLIVELYGYMINNPEYKIWAKIAERVPEDVRAKLIEACGEMPIKGIANCSLDDARDYGCSDADDTLALALACEGKRERFIESLNVQPADMDALVTT